MTPTSLNGLSVRFQQTASVPSVRQRRNLRLQRWSYGRLQSGGARGGRPESLPLQGIRGSAVESAKSKTGPKGPFLLYRGRRSHHGLQAS